MSTKRQSGNRGHFTHEAQPSRRGRKPGGSLGGPWDPEGPPEKPTGGSGDDSRYASIKNYPSSTRGPEKDEKSEKQARKSISKKKAS